jgi:hypothetical protein
MRIRMSVYALTLLGVLCGVAAAQQATLTVKFVDGKTGRPVPNIYIAIKSYSSISASGIHILDSTNDEDGTATVTMDPGRGTWIEAFSEDIFRTCSDKGDSDRFSVDDIFSKGASTVDRCRHRFTLEKNVPGHLVVYIHMLSFWQRMRI